MICQCLSDLGSHTNGSVSLKETKRPQVRSRHYRLHSTDECIGMQWTNSRSNRVSRECNALTLYNPNLHNSQHLLSRRILLPYRQRPLQQTSIDAETTMSQCPSLVATLQATRKNTSMTFLPWQPAPVLPYAPKRRVYGSALWRHKERPDHI